MNWHEALVNIVFLNLKIFMKNEACTRNETCNFVMWIFVGVGEGVNNFQFFCFLLKP